MGKHEHSTDGRRNLAPSYLEQMRFLIVRSKNIRTAVFFLFEHSTDSLIDSY
jgi:hypothetical protein